MNSRLARSVRVCSLILLFLTVAAGVAPAETVWYDYPPRTGDVNSLSDAPEAPNVVGVRALSGDRWFKGNNTYSGATVILGGTVYVDSTSPFGTGPLSLAGGLMWANITAPTVNNNVSLDGRFWFGRAGGSYYTQPIAFSQPLVLNGNYVLVHNGNSGGAYPHPITFSAGVADGGRGFDLAIASGTYNNDAFQLGSGSTFTGATVIHGATLRLIGSLTSTSQVRINPGGQLQIYYTTAGTNLRLGDSVPVRLRGGTLGAWADSGGSSWTAAETVGPTVLACSHSTVSAGAKRANISMTIASLARLAGSTVCFLRVGDGNVNASGGYGYGRLYVTGQAAGFIGGWAVARRSEYVGGSLEDSGYDFAWYDTGAGTLSGVLPMTLSAEPRPVQVAGSTAADHVRVTAAQTALTADTSVGSLAVAGSYPSDLGGHTLDIAGGGLLVASGDYALTNGALTSSGGRLFLFRMGGTFDVNVPIVGATDVSTAGSMRWTANNAFTGNLYVNSGTLTLTAANAFNRTADVAPGATLDIECTNALAATLGLQLWYDGEDHSVCNLGASSHVGWATTNGVFLERGAYTSATLPGYLTGAGTLTVRRTGQARGTVVTFR